MEITADEKRMLEQMRAEAATKSRPVETVDAVGPTRQAIGALVRLAYDLEPKAEVWPQVLAVLHTHGVFRS